MIIFVGGENVNGVCFVFIRDGRGVQIVYMCHVYMCGVYMCYVYKYLLLCVRALRIRSMNRIQVFI